MAVMSNNGTSGSDADLNAARLRTWQRITAGSLFAGYAGYYLGRSCLAIATPLIIESHWLSREEVGLVASVGVLTYAIGKIANGMIVERFGGRRMFLFGMMATIVCTAAFGMADGLWMFVAIWGANRFFQSMGWNALVKTASSWYPVSRQATVMGILSLSFLFGDAIDRLYLGEFVYLAQQNPESAIAAFANWRSVFFIAAATLGLVAVVTALLLRSSPRDLGLEEPSANPRNVYGTGGQSSEAVPLSELLAPLLQSPVFWSICGINFGLTLIRDTFNTWSSLYLKEVAGLKSGEAGIASLVFPLVGGFAAIAAGWTSDHLDGRHGRVVVPSLVLLVGSLLCMAQLNVTGKPVDAMVLVGITSFFLIAPYSYLTGVMALDLGGKRGSATAAGLIDGAGYLGATASGWGVAVIEKHYAWSGVFRALAGVCCLTLIFAVAYLIQSERARSKTAID